MATGGSGGQPAGDDEEVEESAGDMYSLPILASADGVHRSATCPGQPLPLHWCTPGLRNTSTDTALFTSSDNDHLGQPCLLSRLPREPLCDASSCVGSQLRPPIPLRGPRSAFWTKNQTRSYSWTTESPGSSPQTKSATSSSSPVCLYLCVPSASVYGI